MVLCNLFIRKNGEREEKKRRKIQLSKTPTVITAGKLEQLLERRNF